MKIRTYIISKKAISDLEEILRYIVEKCSAEQGDGYYNLIFDEINYICKSSNAANSMEYVRKGYRASKLKFHLIFYEISDQIIEIVRILHESLDIKNRLND